MGTLSVGAYARISDDRQGLKAGVQRQVEDDLAEADRRGWTVIDQYIDNDVSAYSGKKRPEYERLLTDLRSGRIQGVVAYAPDRLHRSPRELEEFVDVVNSTGASVVFVKAGEWDLSTADGRLHARLLGSVARHESEKKSERIKRALQQKAERGEVAHTRHRPYGFMENGVDHDPAEAAHVRQRVADLLAGKVSMRQFAREAGKTPTGLKLLLLSPRMVGMREWEGVLHKGVWEPILDDGTWNELRALLDGRRTPARPRKHLLAGLARCSVEGCGSLLKTAQESRSKAVVYRCPNFHVLRRASRLEQYVTDVVLDHLTTSGRAPVAPVEDVALRAEIRAAEERLKELEERLISGTSTLPLQVVEKAYASARSKLADLMARLPEATESVPAGAGALSEAPWGQALEAWQAWWGSADLEDRQRLLRSVLQEVRVWPTSKGRPRKRGEGEPLSVEGVELVERL